MTNLSRMVLRTLVGAAAIASAVVLVPGAASAQETVRITGRVEPGIWIDPDGCMHWVADGGAEGYMEGRVNPHDGMPVCLNLNTCAVTNTDVLFHTDSARLTPSGRAQLEQFFRSAGAYAYAIYGHTDSRASDEYNMGLSQRRAAAVANTARSVGARVAREIGYGERRPVASNATAAGMQQNRRVEIVCYR
ncbi:OmpA family protein [Roseicyclus mahoneyensis]|jgi:outer membrane protein OmpA-like peptidoglycan-associated protein|uniref:OmpA family protein n=2 Tax=Roseicyclus mahoneyensis TaxID=164332 RepID=A0A316GDI4_9RHOB|nr:OmpA family protein [Roseicyclus mahoneyensis]